MTHVPSLLRTTAITVAILAQLAMMEPAEAGGSANSASTSQGGSTAGLIFCNTYVPVTTINAPGGAVYLGTCVSQLVGCAGGTCIVPKGTVTSLEAPGSGSTYMGEAQCKEFQGSSVGLASGWITQIATSQETISGGANACPTPTTAN
jgi:hypothetical protein